MVFFPPTENIHRNCKIWTILTSSSFFILQWLAIKVLILLRANGGSCLPEMPKACDFEALSLEYCSLGYEYVILLTNVTKQTHCLAQAILHQSEILHHRETDLNHASPCTTKLSPTSSHSLNMCKELPVDSVAGRASILCAGFSNIPSLCNGTASTVLHLVSKEKGTRIPQPFWDYSFPLRWNSAVAMDIL